MEQLIQLGFYVPHPLRHFDLFWLEMSFTDRYALFSSFQKYQRPLSFYID